MSRWNSGPGCRRILGGVMTERTLEHGAKLSELTAIGGCRVPARVKAYGFSSVFPMASWDTGYSVDIAFRPQRAA